MISSVLCRTMALGEDIRRSPSPLNISSSRFNALGDKVENNVMSREESKGGDEETRDAAILLASMSWIAEEDTKNGDEELKKEGDCVKFSHLCSVFEEEYKHEQELENERGKANEEKSRPRTVSISCPTEIFSSLSGEDEFDFRQFRVEEMDEEEVEVKKITSPKRKLTVVSPPSSPYIKSKRNQPISCYQDLSLLTRKVFHINKPTKTILRRKFSWKNYPELEAFLIANREEYLRHSALNYTLQQKQYNNRLTERLLELALSHGYVFDEEAFNFVTVRDRIRCYYKSYVQSSKKRGVIIGYAARKAGLLTEEELEKSAGITGRIIVPN